MCSETISIYDEFIVVRMNMYKYIYFSCVTFSVFCSQSDKKNNKICYDLLYSSDLFVTFLCFPLITLLCVFVFIFGKHRQRLFLCLTLTLSYNNE